VAKAEQPVVFFAAPGDMEAWLEEHGDGTIVHLYIRGDPTAADPQRLRRSRRSRRRAAISCRLSDAAAITYVWRSSAPERDAGCLARSTTTLYRLGRDSIRTGM